MPLNPLSTHLNKAVGDNSPAASRRDALRSRAVTSEPRLKTETANPAISNKQPIPTAEVRGVDSGRSAQVIATAIGLKPDSTTTQDILARRLRDNLARLSRIEVHEKYIARETRMALTFNEQALQAIRINESLNDPIAQLQRENDRLKSLLKGEQTDGDIRGSSVDRVPSLDRNTRAGRDRFAHRPVSEVEFYYSQYSKRLEAAKRRTDERMTRRNGHYGRRAIIRIWVTFCRQYGGGLREIINTVKNVEAEKGERK